MDLPSSSRNGSTLLGGILGFARQQAARSVVIVAVVLITGHDHACVYQLN
jgi:undecaprenyl pyrophosphate phosphatase UppP